jgi:hypothetical protein
VGARLATRYGQQWADYYENGDLSRDASGRPKGVDATGESLGQNHSAYLQLRGIWVLFKPPIPTVDSILVGSSDLGMFNAWTIGKQRFIDRDNARGVFVTGHVGPIEYAAARVALPKLFASANFNTGIDDPFVSNPFWARDAPSRSAASFSTRRPTRTIPTRWARSTPSTRRTAWSPPSPATPMPTPPSTPPSGGRRPSYR